jgi:tetratricopeptide (TPR) repeat protein
VPASSTSNASSCARALLLLNRPAEALECFERASAIQEDEGFAAITDPPAFWYPVKRNVAEAKLALGDRPGARDALEQSLKLRPRDPVAMAMLAKLEAATAAR